MGAILSNIVEFFRKNILLYGLLLIGLLTFLFFGFKKLNLDENIYSVFPKGELFTEFHSVIKENNLNKQIFFSVDAKDKDREKLRTELDSIGLLLDETLGNLVNDIEVFSKDNEENLINYLYDILPALVTEKEYDAIKLKIRKDSIEKSLENVYDKMTSVSSFYLRKIVAKDPLGIGFEKLRMLNPRTDSNAVHVDNGILVTGDGERAIFMGSLNFDLNDNIKNERLNQKLSALKKRVNQKHQDIGFNYFGTFQISYDNARQIKEDTFITLLVSIGLILLLLIGYYRSLLTPLYFVLPAVFAGFSGLGFVGYINPEISAISIATSAVLMGIVLDYSFHFYTHYSHSGNIAQTVKELSFPMLVGSFTTIAAFSALMFTDSVVLQNFGLIALFTLSSAVVFTLLFLPVILHVTRFKTRIRTTKSERKAPKWVFRLSVYAILILSVVFLYKSNQIKFDSDLNNLSFHRDELIQQEELFTGINPNKDKKLHLFVSGSSEQEVNMLNFQLYQKLTTYRDEHGLEELISVAPLSIPESIKKKGFTNWNHFWNEHYAKTELVINEKAAKLDFKKSAFLSFQNWTKQKTPSISSSERIKLIEDLGLSKLIYTKENTWNVVSTVVIDRKDVSNFKKEIREMGGVYIFDTSEMANSLMLSVQDDFNYLLIFSSLLVLISLLIIYGRIELALFSFAPMVLSWIWILGIASVFDIQFNFVNIIIATFIFGLGDDFSIFVTDGLIQKYKTNSNSLQVYRSAIILSGLTTIIGTGALYFSKHPAIHSIAIISVVGIGCIMLVTLVIQPLFFRFFITNRTANRQSPVTLLGLTYSLILFSYFLIGCILINMFLPVLIIAPFSKKRKRHVLNYIVSKLTWSMIYLGIHIKKVIRNPERLDFSKPSIIIANHSSFLDILLMIMLHPKVIIMVKKWVYNSPVFGPFIRYSGYIFIEEGTEYNLDLIQQRVDDGYSIVVFPEGTRSNDGEIKRFHKGAFYLAKELNLDIQPIIIFGAHYVNPKNDFIIKSGSLILDVMERIKCSDSLFEQRFGLMTKEMAKMMREELIIISKREQTPDYLKKRVFYNYLYKSPILEWYVKIKWRMEGANFAFYDSLIGSRAKVYDIGCGLGYLGYYLHYRDAQRKIIGIDYDDEKIAVAQNGYDKSEQLLFRYGDIRNLEIENADVVLYNDVLHYMSLEQQLQVLEKTVSNLNDDGLILIRDGITDLADRHSITKSTEKYSTKIIKFNKTTDELSFFSSKDIFNFAKAQNLKFEMVEQSKRTSNVLFILRKLRDGESAG